MAKQNIALQKQKKLRAHQASKMYHQPMQQGAHPAHPVTVLLVLPVHCRRALSLWLVTIVPLYWSSIAADNGQVTLQMPAARGCPP